MTLAHKFKEAEEDMVVEPIKRHKIEHVVNAIHDRTVLVEKAKYNVDGELLEEPNEKLSTGENPELAESPSHLPQNEGNSIPLPDTKGKTESSTQTPDEKNVLHSKQVSLPIVRRIDDYVIKPVSTDETAGRKLIIPVGEDKTIEVYA